MNTNTQRFSNARRLQMGALATAATLAAGGVAFSVWAAPDVAPASAPYSEGADAKAEIAAALLKARTNKQTVIVVFGANWCPDCRVLDTAMKTGTSAPLLARDFQVVKVNVGKYNQNMDLATTYEVPLKKGIPAVAMLSPEGKVVYATKSGELSDARKMGESGIYDFFKAHVNQKSAKSPG
jgi:thioredoxin 1